MIPLSFGVNRVVSSAHSNPGPQYFIDARNHSFRPGRHSCVLHAGQRQTLWWSVPEKSLTATSLEQKSEGKGSDTGTGLVPFRPGTNTSLFWIEILFCAWLVLPDATEPSEKTRIYFWEYFIGYTRQAQCRKCRKLFEIKTIAYFTQIWFPYWCQIMCMSKRKFLHKLIG